MKLTVKEKLMTGETCPPKDNKKTEAHNCVSVELVKW